MNAAPLRVAALQSSLVWADPLANVAAMSAAVEAAGQADLFVLPEMFTTGFATRPEGVAELLPDGSCVGLDWMRRISHERGCAVAGSIAVCEDGRYFNRFCFVAPEGEWFYDKHHLFTYSGEHERFCAGSERVVVEWRGWRIRLAVCYDLRFPGWLRNVADGARTAAGAYDLLLVVASWPEPRAAAWKSLLRARAIENQCYVVGVNRVGTDPACVYSGDSAIIDAYGSAIAECDPCVECAAVATLDPCALSSFRASFPVLADAD